VEDRVNRLIQSDQHLDQIEAALDQRIKKNRKDKHSQKLLGDLLFRTNDLDRAFEAYKTVDELHGTGGRYILRFIQTCLTQGLFDQAIESSNYLLSLQTPMDVAAVAQLYIARSYEGQEKFDDAISTYEGIKNTYESFFPHETAFSRFQIGEINLFQFKKPDDAFPRYLNVVLHHEDSNLYPLALVRLGDCMMVKGDLDSARALLTGALKKPKSDLVREEIDPKGFYVNNSLERIIVMGENQELDRPLLSIFANALLEKLQGRSESALSGLDQLISAKSEKLSDLAQLEIGKIYRDEEKFSESLKAFEKLLQEYPQSLFRAQAQKLIGDVYNYDLEEREKAIEAYQKLLKEYDRSVYVDETRDKLRELQAETAPPSSG
jgi:tetratricopeptide (TPR) repeat protein